ncbi:unnamed protein product [Pleuronectes platessa]|uniref:Uncharacterized protein n=1 Tax=Pleuronectes platessa TaxID=8262 RepID=A0A9N7YX66_PLEPL|nr:unnamed protein product [Pleuronectes platessa]
MNPIITLPKLSMTLMPSITIPTSSGSTSPSLRTVYVPMIVLLVPLDDSAEDHQGAHLHSSPSGYIYPGCAPSPRQFVRVTTVDPVILLTCSSSPLTISRSCQQPRHPALLLFLPADDLPELSATPSSCPHASPPR